MDVRVTSNWSWIISYLTYMNERFEFLLSNRFWALVLGDASTILLDPDFPTQPWYVTLGKFLVILSGGFIAIRTVDRFGEKAGAVDTGKVIAPPTPASVDLPGDQGVTP